MNTFKPTPIAAVVAMAACLLITESAEAQYASVQAAYASRASGSAYSFPNPHAAGNAIVVAASWAGTGTPTISDTQGNNYTLARRHSDGSNSTAGVWVAFNIAAGANSVTLTLADQRFDSTYLEYSGLASLDQTASASGTTVSPNSSATPTTTSANQMVFGFASRNSPALTAGEGFTPRASGAWNRFVMAEDERVTSTGAQTATFGGTGGAWIAVVVTFAESGAGSPPPPPPPPPAPSDSQPYACVQASFASTNSGRARAFSQDNIAGNTIVVASSWGGAGTPTISDRRGNRYTLARMQTDGSFSVGVWVAFNIAAGPNSVTLTLSGQRFDTTYLEYSGLGSRDQVAGASGSNVPPNSSATPPTTSANEMVFGFASRNYPDLTAGEGFTARASGSRNRSVMAEDKRVTSTGAQTATFGGTGGSWIAVVVTFAEAAQPSVRSIANPYVGGTPRKTQLHVHSRVIGRTTPCPAGDTGGSDGAVGDPTCPSERASAYAAAGYSVVAITDHDMRSGIAGCTWVDNQCMLNGVLYLAGSEQTVTTTAGSIAHLPGIAVSENRGNGPPSPAETAQQTLDGAQSDGGLAFLAHPSRAEQVWSWNVVSGLTGVGAIEVASAYDTYRGDALWDRMLGNGFRTAAVANDDTHALNDFNRAWTMVYTSTLTKQAVLDSIRGGNSYAVRCLSTSPCLDLTGISVAGETLSASTNQAARFMWIGYKEGVASESGTNMTLDSSHVTNRLASISGRPFTSADINRLLYVMNYTAGYWVRTGAYLITGINGTAAILDRPVASSTTTNVWWELGGGRVLRTTTGTSDSYTVTRDPATGDHIYVRLYAVLDQNREVWSQPFFVR